ncbi:MAG: helix-turn-helix transcriptional regulator [Victivallaceae bacterium]|nr:helix-turn-helix transcriptional regulator [Victivallaceae bacterium]
MTALAREIKRRGIKQNVLAAKMGVTPAAVCLQMKTGIRMVKLASRYARAMNCDPRLLLDF